MVAHGSVREARRFKEGAANLLAMMRFLTYSAGVRKLLTVLAVATASAGVAGAQQTFMGSVGNYTLNGCYITREGVRCDFSYSPKEDGRIYFNTSLFEVITAAGGNLRPRSVSAGGGNWRTSTEYINAYRGVSIKVGALFDLPSSTTSLRILTVEGQRADNVAVRNSATPAPQPVAAPAPANTGNYNATLTNCKPGAGGTLTCTATLTPRR